MDPVICPADGDKRLAEIAQGGFGRGSDVLFGHHDQHPPRVHVDHLAVADLVLHPAEGMDAKSIAVDAPFRLLGHLDLRDQITGCRIRSRELDASGFADKTAPAVAPDEIFRPERLTIAQLDINAGVVLREACNLSSAIDGHRQFVDPARENALDVVLPKPEPVIVPGGKVADVQRSSGEPSHLRHLPFSEEAIGDATLIEDLDGA